MTDRDRSMGYKPCHGRHMLRFLTSEWTVQLATWFIANNILKGEIKGFHSNTIAKQLDHILVAI